MMTDFTSHTPKSELFHKQFFARDHILTDNSRPEVINPFNPEFTIVIFIYKPRIAVAILDL